MAGASQPDEITCAELVEAVTAIEAWIGRIRDILAQSSDVIPPLRLSAGGGLMPYLNGACRPPIGPAEHLEGGRHEESGYELV